MWHAANLGAPVPHPQEPLTVVELRRVCAESYTEGMWEIGQAMRAASVSGSAQWTFVADTLAETRERIRTPGSDAGDVAYWADESAVAAVQRYLHVRLLIYNPHAADAHRAQCLGDLKACADMPLRYILLRYTHNSTKLQHYELYSLGGTTVFERASLPDGVVSAFASRVSF
mmetsp:Transcript_17015/g.39293  ORF Transcript_17015/g.39293 Transcript_17015/m.39293 type:complete len:172 (+) Transcript_17015:974-1489(+)